MSSDIFNKNKNLFTAIKNMCGYVPSEKRMIDILEGIKKDEIVNSFEVNEHYSRELLIEYEKKVGSMDNLGVEESIDKYLKDRQKPEQNDNN